MPPYCGVPRLSHQFPVEVVVAVMVETGAVVEVGTIAVVVAAVTDVVVDAIVAAVVLVVVDAAQDVSIIEAAIRNASKIQITPFFIYTSVILY